MAFAVRIVNMCKYLRDSKHEWVMSKQLLRSGTAIGAMVHESEFAESDADFIHKLSIAQKEANETIYWLKLLHATEYISDKENESISCNVVELMKLIVSSIKTMKKKVFSV